MKNGDIKKYGNISRYYVRFTSLFLFMKNPEIYKFSIIGICNMILVLVLTAFLLNFSIFFIYSLFF